MIVFRLHGKTTFGKDGSLLMFPTRLVGTIGELLPPPPPPRELMSHMRGGIVVW